ncbi:hypothetical protein AKI39_12350 [Bordetella sp. H567]|uniref:universal stress protein n=1 Tax=Bordetella sp. H567 TaxID=1697043 RepID=UPI00081C4185|nr:universal stress protein [Bordetella sp. H567]AOB31309.1 hypothetical protein AKI39_12350 [Bordetella sp. H567]
MYRKIMVALDGSETAQAALRNAIQLAAQEHATVYAVSVAEYPTDYYMSLAYDPNALRSSVDTEAGKVLQAAGEAAAGAGVTVVSHLVHGSEIQDTVAEQLRRAASALDVDLVVLGTHGRRGFKRLLLGSVVETFIRISDRPVLLYPGGATR